MWKIEKIVRKGDYNYALVKNHPNATKTGYVLEHRIIMENHLGRILNPNELVHHKNGNKLQNVIENLEIMMRGEHERFHGKQHGRKTAVLKCPGCGKIFEKFHNKTHLVRNKQKVTCCSARCRGIFSRKLQMFGKTLKLEKAISENLVRIYRKYPENSEQTENNQDA
jgi:hypothetical protein